MRALRRGGEKREGRSGKPEGGGDSAQRRAGKRAGKKKDWLTTGESKKEVWNMERRKLTVTYCTV
jgi:hypothetical protein